MMMNSKRFGSKLSWPNFKGLSRNSLGGTEENHKTSIRRAGRRDRVLNLGPPEYEAGVLTTRPRRLVGRFLAKPHFTTIRA
jgi:hypothetical protein